MTTQVDKRLDNRKLPPYLLAELQHQLGCADIFGWLEDEAERLAALSAEYSLDQVKLSREIFANRGVLSVRECPGLNQDACIVPISGGYQIKYRRGIPKHRLRFALAHELGHTLFFAPDGTGRSLARMQNHEDPSIEALCDFFASALLLPKVRLSKKLADLKPEHGATTDPPLHLIPTLSEAFGVAPQAIARRIVFDFYQSHRTVFSIKRMSAAKHDGWRTMWFASVATTPEHTPTGWRIPLDSNGRKVPAEIIPEIPYGQTVSIMLDGRLSYASTPKSPEISRTPLSRQAPMEKVEALAAFVELPGDMFKEMVDIAIFALG